MKNWTFVWLALSAACASSSPETTASSPDAELGASGASGAAGSSDDSNAQGGATSDASAGLLDDAVAHGGGGGSGSGGALQSDAPSGDAADLGPETSPEVLAACTSFATTFCAKVESCSPFALGVVYGDVATCKQRLLASCVPNSTATGTSAIPTKTSTCERSIASLACPGFLAGDLGAACAVNPGMLANGAACGDDAQCATAFCARAPDALCGTCHPPTQAGDPCVQGSCSVGTVCPAGQSTCITPVAGQVDAPCTALEQCDLAHGVGCNTSSKKCIALTLAPAQGACGASLVGPTTYAVCPANGTCSAVVFGHCSAPARDGESCSSSDTGAHCQTPARCVAGKCAIPAPNACH